MQAEALLYVVWGLRDFRCRRWGREARCERDWHSNSRLKKVVRRDFLKNSQKKVDREIG